MTLRDPTSAPSAPRPTYAWKPPAPPPPASATAPPPDEMWRHIQALQARVLLLQQWVDSYVNTSVPGTVLDPESEKMRLITAEQVQRATSLDARTIDRLVAAGQFPRPLRLSPRRRAWRALQVRQWIAQQQPPPDTEPPPDTQPLLPAAPPAHSENVP